MGTFYEIDMHGRISVVSDVLTQPGNRYALLYGLADSDFPKDGPYPRQSDAGELMALASFSNRSVATAEEQGLLPAPDRTEVSGPTVTMSIQSYLLGTTFACRANHRQWP
jgi:hypothetical protein